MKRKWVIGISVLFLMLVAATMVGPIMSNVEQPKYDLLSRFGDIEIRAYDPVIVAEVKINGQREQAIREGFRLLADYIFGNNVVQKEIKMTAPVEQSLSEQISMTAPVEQQGENNTWAITFTMPSQYTIKTIPQPNDSRVLLKKVGVKKFIVIKFSGSNTDVNLETNKNKLYEFCELNKIKIIGLPKYAFYNPPWTLPFLRHNEVMIEVR